MGWKNVLFVLITIGLVFSILAYLFFPFFPVDFNFDANSNFSTTSDTSMQFYPNMRFSTDEVSFTIHDSCNLEKEGEMKEAFHIIENLTPINFYELSDLGDIDVFCEEKNKLGDDGLFIAGEGGPVNVTTGSNFNVISKGEIILIRNSDCERPNIALHELLHVLGFDHSNNTNNIMYPVSKCKQTIGDDIVNKLNELYSIEPLSDLEFKSANAIMKGRALDLNFTIKNEGLIDSQDYVVNVYADGKEIKSFSSERLKVGYGQSVEFTNILVSQITIKEIKIVAEGNFNELDKSNNKVVLKIK
ncbi:MAG: matrixin family metalloprotease [Nanoarchaeota archaeon]|nr:matrixin family metalloprotease [Nanoarchaeota archaeon]